jgi:hypothetical protein
VALTGLGAEGRLSSHSDERRRRPANARAGCQIGGSGCRVRSCKVT